MYRQGPKTRPSEVPHYRRVAAVYPHLEDPALGGPWHTSVVLREEAFDDVVEGYKRGWLEGFPYELKPGRSHLLDLLITPCQRMNMLRWQLTCLLPMSVVSTLASVAKAGLSSQLRQPCLLTLMFVDF